MSFKHFLFSAALLICLFPATSRADTVTTHNGDRLSGKIVRKSGDLLILQTDYAGEIKLQWSKVASITTDGAVKLQFAGEDEPVSAKLDVRDGQQVVQMEGKGDNPEALPLTRLAYINPLPEETRNGVNYQGHVNASLTKNDGNTNNQSLYGEVGFSGRAKDHRYDINAKANRAKDQGNLTSSNWLASGNYDKFRDARHFIYGRGSAEHDEFKGIQQRDVIGAGYGLQLVDTPQTQFSVRGGLDYVTTRRTASSTSTADDNYPSLGWGVKFSHKLESYRAELFHEQDGFMNITDTSQITLRTRSGLRVPLLAGITATSQFNVDWERTPDPGRKSIDSMLLIGLGYAW